MPASAIIGAAASIGGRLLDGRSQRQAAKMNYRHQKEFAQHGIRWKVEDAKAAGLHPLAALGAQTTSYSPVHVGTDFAGMGQDISRAIDATRTGGEKQDAVLSSLAVERAGLENELLRAQIAKVRGAGQSPGIPAPTEQRFIAGQGNAPLMKAEPMEVTVTRPGAPEAEPGSGPSIGYAVMPGGGMYPVKPKWLTERMEDDTIGNAEWSVMNRLIPRFTGFNQNPPERTKEMIDRGEYWVYHPFRGGYYPARRIFPGVYW
ncbi:MAG: hypothetical protein QXT77_07485 [Candidatus Methanomethylicaceae archaeon]